MAKKTKPSTKKPTKPTARSVPASVGPSKSKANNKTAPRLATFDEARNAMIDSLIQIIEEAERQLAQAKRATSYKELP